MKNLQVKKNYPRGPFNESAFQNIPAPGKAGGGDIPSGTLSPQGQIPAGMYPRGYPSPRGENINDQQFKQWLIGFIEAQGSFTITTRGDVNFVITQGYRNIFILYYIKMRLKTGRVVKQGTQTFRFVIQDYQGLLFIINLLNGNLVLMNSQSK